MKPGWGDLTNERNLEDPVGADPEGSVARLRILARGLGLLSLEGLLEGSCRLRRPP